MPIEFPCEQCGRTLRVPDGAAGKLARCPKCGHVGRAPAATGEHGESTIPRPSYPPSPGAYARDDSDLQADTNRNPFAEGNNAFPENAGSSAGRDDNPYAAPTAPAEYYAGPDRLSEWTRQRIRNKVAGPAIGLIVMGIVYLLLLGIMLVSSDMQEWGVVGLIALMMAIKGGILIGGGVQMKNLNGYGTAMTAAVLAVLPCCFCWIVELPFGIWALMVLSDQYVKLAFEEPAGVIAQRGDP